MHDTHGWMSGGGSWGGGMWIWSAAGILTVILLALMIGKLTKK
ncbi:MAG TPA: hypothetical protein VF331_02355 [Polyangiales bacterium]